MRLSSIKLAGFKSFVEPTHFQLPGQLVGVVGPNGCGKSNIIDAVRWVLGESRASELRGESMQDVIFNGSTHRKPAGRASVELVFDNADGRAAGQWSQYAEISVKRVLTRDGGSNYYINQQAVRRRDIQDIFLGTGLGPRAYAIIGQGMIARIIEAKPDELRVFLEEAAGVSKYKERRRETENRLSDTRENLTRVEDILRELSGQLEKLIVQAEVAQKYQTLQAEGESKQHLLWLLRKKEAQTEQQRQQAAMMQAQADLEAQTTSLRHIEAELDTLRTAHYQASDQVHLAQGALYEVNAEVSRIEAEIRHALESRSRVQGQIAALGAQREQWQTQSQQAQDALIAAEEALALAEGRCSEVQVLAADQHDALPEQEAEWRRAQHQVSERRAQIVQLEQQLKLEAAQQRHADQQLQHLAQRRERLQGEIGGLAPPDADEVDRLRGDVAEQDAILQDARHELATRQEQLPMLEQERQTAQQQVQRETAALASLEARLTALKQLQERVQIEGKLQPWLDKHGLAALPSVWKQLQIEAGWEPALEAVLRERLQAREISNLDWVTALASDAPPAKLAFYAPPLAALPLAQTSGLQPMVALLRIQDPGMRAVLQDWLGQVYTAASLTEALALRSQLPSGSLVVVQAGHLVSATSVQLYAPDSEQAGMLAREQEIEQLGRQIRAQHLLGEAAQARATQAQAAHAQAGQALNTARMQVEQDTRNLHAQQMELLKLSQAMERYAHRSEQIREELADIDAQIEVQQAQRLESEILFEQYDAQLADQQMAFEDAQQAFAALDSALADARDQLRGLERSVQEAQFAERNLRNRIAELQRTRQMAEEQAARLAITLEQAHDELARLEAETTPDDLASALHRRAAQEAKLSAARTELDTLTQHLRQQDEARLHVERGQQPLRERITELQLKEQAARLNVEQYAEQLSAVQVDEAELTTRLTPDMRAPYLQAEVTRIHQAIQALGPVNMAALEELSAATERKNFLDAQSADLRDASATLEDAIRKIDSETRALLQGTFNQVNTHFGELFPSLFGGGQAKLIMTGEEILDAGVQVMAQPPGKKNATIHLLSGGEKALTAIALVFAMFQLNPAPFCLLDEVDAPLDDANTERYARMVQRMSANTQFVFISHNKIAMEMAQQLIGVTMQEQGVSRIVAVDMEQALSFAAAA